MPCTDSNRSQTSLLIHLFCRKQHREEVVKLQQLLKSTTASTKGGAAEAERSKKELEKLRYACPSSSQALSSSSADPEFHPLLLSFSYHAALLFTVKLLLSS